MISFYPGPSRVDERIPEYVKEAYEQGVLNINHRSDEFMELAKATIAVLKEKLNIPKAYSIFFTSSATECWEIIAQSLIKNGSFHVYNGAFGEKWFHHTQRITSKATRHRFDINEELEVSAIRIPISADIICITHNETSNGTQVSNDHLQNIREHYPDQCIAVDATSSMAGVELDFKYADIWYASVQKCFGLPAGLAVMICSPKAIERALQINDISRYNSLPSIIKMMEKYQTTHTPNVMDIYLLNRVMTERKGIQAVGKKTYRRYIELVHLIQEIGLRHLINNKEVRSYTVLPITAEANKITDIKKFAFDEGIILGNGYGELKETTLRVANFPALKNTEINLLKEFLKNYSYFNRT